MEISPIAGLRPMPAVKSSSAPSDPSRIFAAEFRKQAQQETGEDNDSAGDAEGGKETAKGEGEQGSPDESLLDSASNSTISFFA
ncbi:hypothetical protein DYQ86_01465 [Acidobacteria bacterium AB60]|nr:hypothetical protein DYQ86_01465 [Acidobacteria bacterium AB60]